MRWHEVNFGHFAPSGTRRDHSTAPHKFYTKSDMPRHILVLTVSRWTRAASRALSHNCAHMGGTQSSHGRGGFFQSQPLNCAPVARGREEWPVRARPGQRGGNTFASQFGQDAFLSVALFNTSGAQPGTYLDIGCNDGKSNSNTWFFSQKRGWRGVCLEADPSKFAEIPRASGRKDGVHAAVSSADGVASFAVVNVPDGGLSGLSNTLDHARAKDFGPMRKTMDVPTLSPLTLLRKHYPNSREPLDYVSIDVEGHELQILRSWPLHRDAWCVNVFTIENNHWCNSTVGILPQVKQILGAEYTHVRSMGVDEIFIRRTQCPNTVVPLMPPPYTHFPSFAESSASPAKLKAQARLAELMNGKIQAARLRAAQHRAKRPP